MAERFLDQEVVTQIEDYFKGLDQPVALLFFNSQSDESGNAAEIKQLAQEVVEISDKLSFQEYDLAADAALAAQWGVDKAPTLVLAGKDGEKPVDYGIRFAGFPAGHEFGTFINDIVMISKRESGLKSDTKEFLATLKQPLKFLVFYTPTCPHCPVSVSFAHRLALESPLIQAEGVCASDFYGLSNDFGVSGVPHTAVLDEQGKLVATVIGGLPEERMLFELKKQHNFN